MAPPPFQIRMTVPIHKILGHRYTADQDICFTFPSRNDSIIHLVAYLCARNSMASEQLAEDRRVNTFPRRFGPILCDYCNAVFSALERLEWRFDLECESHPTTRSLRDAARSGCRLCILINHQLRRKGIYDNNYMPLQASDIESIRLEVIRPYKGSFSIHLRIDKPTSSVELSILGKRDCDIHPSTSRESFSTDLILQQAALLTCHLSLYRTEECA